MSANPAQVKTIRPNAASETQQELTYFVGISQMTVGSQAIAMQLAIIPPGGHAKPHYHPNQETAIYLLKGRVKTLYGDDLKHSVINEAGDFLFIPPGVLHQPFNLSESEPAQAIVARNNPHDQEDVVLVEVPPLNHEA
jgi:uncharacterized RmlC-like cupin family protein